MPVVAAVFALAAVAWGAIVARRSSLLVGVGVLLVVAYAGGHDFWTARIGPLPLTLDRMLLAGLLVLFAIGWRTGRIRLRALTGTDWLLASLLVVLGISALMSGQPDITDGVTSKWGRLMASFAIPGVVYAVLRQLSITEREWRRLLAVLVVLGVYLACTAVFEAAEWWPLVFPRYIADPALGIHFGRARGPELNSVSLGMYITACALCAWTLLPQVRQRWQQLVLIVILPLLIVGVLLTVTRSTWIGLAAGGMTMAAFYIPRQWRLPTFTCAALGAVFVACLSWNQLMDIQREGDAGDSEHSVDQRASFAYVSWNMFCDHPLMGVGFGRFFDQKLSYLSDRRQTVELESIRKLHHHNTLLSILTETGLVGFSVFIAALVAWTRCAWRVARSAASSPWIRAQGILMLALIANYLSSAGFHDVTLLPSQELLLFVFAGITVNLCQVVTNIEVANSRSTSSVIASRAAAPFKLRVWSET
jgi:O-antigen ligase